MARRRPRAAALVVPTGRGRLGALRYHGTNFRELADRVNRCAAGLAAREVGQGTRALIFVRPGLDLVTCAFALLRLGAIPVVLDPGMGRRNLMACVRRSVPEVLIGVPEAHALSLLHPRAFGDLRLRVTAGRRLGWGGVTLRECLSSSGSPPQLQQNDNETAAILFTSGSTGPPKGVIYRQRHFGAQLDLLRGAFGFEPGEVDLTLLPIFTLFNPALGITSVVPELDPRRPLAADPAALVQALREMQVTNSFGSPALWEKIGKYCQHKNIVLPGVRRLLIAGAAVVPELIQILSEVFPGARLHTPYGATEALPLCSIESREILGETGALTRSGAGVCVGRPLPGIAIRIVPIASGGHDEKEKTGPLPPGEVGEVLVSGPVVTEAYDKLPETTAAAKISTENVLWHRMGDAGRLDTRGRLWICGRLEHIVQTSSGPLYPDGVEPLFRAHPEVRRAALIGLGQSPAQRPGIVVEPVPGARWWLPGRRRRLARELGAIARAHPMTAGIEAFFLKQHFPVDVRHNAKIRREILAAWAAKKRPLRSEANKSAKS